MLIGVPAFRLPREAIEMDVKLIERLGVRFRGDNDTYDVALEGGAWRCSCHSFHSLHGCAHILALQSILDAMLEEQKRDGVTWTPPLPTSLVSPNSPASIKLVPGTKTLMVVYNDHSGRVPAPKALNQRAPLVAAFSTDGAKSWIAPQVIEDDLTGWYCYTAIHFTNDAVLLAYVAGNEQLGHLSRLRIRRIPLAALHIPKA